MNLGSPTLSYVGAVDITSATNGSTLYNILFDSTLTTLGNVLMFEYKLQQYTVVNSNPDVTTLAYVNTEQASMTAGIANQWQISVPADDNIYDPTISITIQVRVYSGVSQTNEIVVTDWSNELNVHNPPAMPTYYTDGSQNLVFYNQGAGSALDDLYICLVNSTNYDYTTIKFVVAYYYTDLSGVTIWRLSEPSVATEHTFNGDTVQVVTVPNFGKVSLTDPYVYVAVYAVYTFEDASANLHYSVSHISDTATAQISTYFNAPNLVSLVYQIYEVPSTQNMVLTWTAPGDSVIDIYVIDYYTIQISVNDGSWNNLTDVSGDITTATIDVSEYGCNNNLAFRVVAVNTEGGLSVPSNILSQNIFIYSEAPTNLSVTNVSINPDDTINMNVLFEPPSDIGCGSGQSYLIYVDGQLVNTQSYGDASYNVPLNNLSVGSSGTVSVLLQTLDTNSSDLLDGASIDTNYIASNLVLYQVDYQVYINNSQDMNLSWSNPVQEGWTFTNYSVYVDASLVYTSDVSGNSYTYLNTSDCGTTHEFIVVAHMDNDGLTYDISSNAVSINVYYYPTAPVNLSLENVTNNSMDVLFDNPTSIGCSSDGWVFKIEVDNVIVGSQTYNESGNYNVPITGTFNSYGIVYVYLQTMDTNPPNQAIDGPSISIPYISSSFTLNPIDYLIYSESRTQYMDLSWSPVDITGSDWIVTNYEIFLALDGSTNFVTTGLNTSNTYDTYSNSYGCNTSLTFKVVAHMTINYNGNPVTYDITSNNTQSINVFEYASAPDSGIVNWAVSESVNTPMDINLEFSASQSQGCGVGQYYHIVVYDASSNPITDASLNVPYGDVSVDYQVNFDGLPYSSNGTVKIYLVTTDTNSNGLQNGAILSLSYITDQLPVYTDVSYASVLTFNVTSQNPLAPVAGVAYPEALNPGPGYSLQYIQWNINSPLNGITVVPSTGANNEHIYSVTIDPILFGGVFPDQFGIVTSNTAGIKELAIPPN